MKAVPSALPSPPDESGSGLLQKFLFETVQCFSRDAGLGLEIVFDGSVVTADVSKEGFDAFPGRREIGLHLFRLYTEGRDPFEDPFQHGGDVDV